VHNLRKDSSSTAPGGLRKFTFLIALAGIFSLTEVAAETSATTCPAEATAFFKKSLLPKAPFAIYILNLPEFLRYKSEGRNPNSSLLGKSPVCESWSIFYQKFETMSKLKFQKLNISAAELRLRSLNTFITT
jgi:hypothetical protein